MFNVYTEASGGRVAGKAWRALATEAAGCVAANGSFSAPTQEALGEVAFVDIWKEFNIAKKFKFLCYGHRVSQLFGISPTVSK
jgi:hypothetical protein